CELLVASGFGAWRVKHDYSADDAWDMDLSIEPIADAPSSVWLGPHMLPHGGDAPWGFLEETLTREKFKARYPKAALIDFDSAKSSGCSGWFGSDSVRIAEYWRIEERDKVIALLTDGKTVDLAEVESAMDEMAA